MTTITNFIEGNFIANPQPSVDSPLWVLDAPLPHPAHQLMANTLVARCLADSKPLIHLDLGLKHMSSAHADTIECEGLSLAMPHPSKPYYLVRTHLLQRSQEGFLNELGRQLHAVVGSGKLRKDKEEKGGSLEWGLLVEGLEAYQLLTAHRTHNHLETFIAVLANLPPAYKQTVVLTRSPLLSPEVNFALERISTCLTRLQPHDPSQPATARCISTVRRFTGYSKQEEYTVVLGEGRVKVGKDKPKKQVKEEGVHGLGFKAEKDESARQQEASMREMIFPHLKKRQACEKTSCQNNCECHSNLIVLDDEQEDEDDVDV